MNYIVQLKSYGFKQVIFVWIKFFPFEKHFSFLSLIAMCLWLDTLIYIGKCIFQQSIAYSIQNFDIFYPSGPAMVHIWVKLKLVKFYRYNSNPVHPILFFAYLPLIFLFFPKFLPMLFSWPCFFGWMCDSATSFSTLIIYQRNKQIHAQHRNQWTDT